MSQSPKNDDWDILFSSASAEPSGEVFHHESPKFRCEFFIGDERPELVKGLSSFNISTGVHLFDVTLLDADKIKDMQHLKAINAKIREVSGLLVATAAQP